MRTIKVLASLITTFLSIQVFAQVQGGGVMVITANTTAGATAVPTLSGSMLIVVSLLVAAFGYRIISKSNHHSKTMLIALVTAGTLGFSLSGAKLINDSYAGTPVVPVLPNTSNIIIEYGLQEYENQTGAPYTIQSITKNPDGSACGNPLPFGTSNECLVGDTIPDNASCFIRCEPQA